MEAAAIIRATSREQIYQIHQYSDDGRRLRVVERTTSFDVHEDSPAIGGGFLDVWSAYEAMGPQAYYASHGASYRNPHEPAIAAALILALTEWSELLSPLRHVLDLACGSGEASLAFKSWLVGRDARFTGNMDSGPHLEAADPHTNLAYERRVGSAAHKWSFEDISSGLFEREGLTWDAVLCSYALHLLDEQTLHSTLRAIARSSRFLIVLTPHRRPTDAAVCRSGWTQVGALTLHHVRLRIYRSGTEAPM